MYQKELNALKKANRFLVVDKDRYNYLQKSKLEKALRKLQEDRENRNSRVLTSEEHFKELDDALRD